MLVTHVTTSHPFGSVASRSGPIMAAAGFFEAVRSGKGGHAAIPQHTTDPISAASNVVLSFSREADPLDSQVVSVGKFQGGGTFNVILDSVTIGGTFRSFSKESFIQLKHRIEEVVITQASVQRCNATIVLDSDEMISYPVTVNDENLHEHFQNVARQGVFAPGHSPNYIVNEDVLPYEAALHASLAATYLLENQPESPKGSRSHVEL
ncbi:Peptidase M20, dimerization domain containing protein [Parasponia andersonii]|uniref:Peptidase M20, dimerization domain containing protein n=1 Tax=Parasponia andersonii TaxID=3476 RepID=A0A2P5CN98_PARAD|nr:Peptidase M20, dimerization domain containing protein [Parasponia andersonii]